MATLAQPFAPLKAGSHELQVSMIGWHNIGSCTITTNSDYQFAANGNYNVMGHSGTFNMTLSLDDQNSTSTTGPCTIVNAGQTVKGTYSLSGQTMTFTGDGHTITASPNGGGVLLAISGYPNGRIAP
jgi:hypothetical protein